MNFKHLRHIVTLADVRNFARAAEQLHITQPALTRSIQTAEAAWGLRLFDRGSLEVAPTPAGAFMLARARSLLFDSHCLERDLALYRDRSLGDVAFGVGPTPASSVLAELLTAVLPEHPGIAFRVEVGNWGLLQAQLRNEEIEFFVADVRDLPDATGLQIQPFHREPGGFYVRAGHPLAQAGPLDIRQIFEYGVAAVRVPRQVTQMVGRMLGLPEGEPLRLRLQCDDVATLIRVALATDLVLGVAHVSVAGPAADGRLLPLAVRGLPEMASQMGIVSLRGRTLSPMAELLVERLRSLA